VDGTCKMMSILKARSLQRTLVLQFAIVLLPLVALHAYSMLVERHYIACTDDRAIPIALQRRMISESPCATVTDIDADHSPFICAEEALTRALVALA